MPKLSKIQFLILNCLLYVHTVFQVEFLFDLAIYGTIHKIHANAINS